MKEGAFVTPLGLRECIEARQSRALRLGWVPFVNVLLLSFGLVLLSSERLCPPGIHLKLPKVDKRWVDKRPVRSIISISEGHRIFYKRKMYTMENLNALFAGERKKGGGLLIKADESVCLNFLSKLIEAANESGFEYIQMAVSPEI